MDYAQQQRNPTRHLVSFSLVILLHAVVVYALVNGLARKVIDVIKKPIETKIVEEAKAPPPPPPPAPPPPKITAPPPPFIPPPEVNITITPPVQNTISQVSNLPPPPQPQIVPTPPPVPQAVHVPLHLAPVIDAAHSCDKPPYPLASRRNEEVGTVTLKFLIGVDGRVLKSEVESTSGHPRLDEAARNGLALCLFKPGSTDGKPEQSWARLQYVWKLE